MPIMKKTLSTKEPQMSGDQNTDSNISQTPTTPVINIAIETDDGNLQPPEIDDVVDVCQEDVVTKVESEGNEKVLERRLSITERIQKIKLGEDAANSMKIEAEQRRKVLENLLEEHEHIVRQIVSADTKDTAVATH